MPTLRLYGDSSSAVNALRDVNKAVKETTRATVGAAKGLTTMEKRAESIKAAISPQERYNQKVRQLGLLVNKNKLSLDQATRAAQMYQREIFQTGKSGSAMFSRMATNIASTAAAYVSLQSAIAAVRAELEASAAIEDRRAREQQTYASAEQQLRINLSAFTGADQDRIIARVQAMASAKGISDPKAAINAFGQLISGTGREQVSFEALDIASTLRNLDPAQMEKLAGGIGDVVQTAELGTRQAAGLLVAAQAQSRLTDLGDIGAQMGKVLSLYARPGGGADYGTGAAMFAALTRLSADTEGQLSRTAALNIPREITKFFREDYVAGRYDPSQIDTANKQLDMLMSDADLAAEFTDQLVGLRAQANAALKNFLLNPEGVNRKAFERNREQFRNEQFLLETLARSERNAQRGQAIGAATQAARAAGARSLFDATTFRNVSIEEERAAVDLINRATQYSVADRLSVTSSLMRTIEAGGMRFDQEGWAAFLQNQLQIAEARLDPSIGTGPTGRARQEAIVAIEQLRVVAEAAQQTVDLQRQGLQPPPERAE